MLASNVTHQEGEADLVIGQTLKQVLALVDRVAATCVPVVLCGETGTGKEIVARLVHQRSPRHERRMIPVNCGAIPAQLVESTLFGHERGAFTGAMQRQIGLFEEADESTIFLDEIGELPLAAQAALLRVLETGSFCRVGSSCELRVDVRLVAATHRDLNTMVQSGHFRADLYYRLGGVVIEIPPLRERFEEIAGLARHFIDWANLAHHRCVSGIDAETMALLRAYSWPGNVRELRNVVERAVVMTNGASISVADLPAYIPAALALRAPAAALCTAAAEARPEAPPLPPAGDAGTSMRRHVHQFEARLLHETLAATGWNRAEAARRLGLPVRTLSYRMKVLGIRKP